MARPADSAKPEFTLVYDDLSWEAPDLKLMVPPIRHDGFNLGPDLRLYKYAQDGIAGRNIRSRFEAAVDAFARSVPRMKVGEVYPGLTFTPKAIPHGVKLVPLSKFIETHRFDNPKMMHLTLPLDPMFVSFQFADVAEEDEETKERLMGIYSSPATIALITEWNARIVGTNSTHTPNKSRLQDIKTRPPASSLALVDVQTTTIPLVDLYALRDLANQWQSTLLWREFWYRDAFFTDLEDNKPEAINLLAMGQMTKEVKMHARLTGYQSNVAEADTLRQVITEGLAGNPRSSDWSKFLTKGLYDPRLFLHVWDMINRKEERD